MENLSNKFDFEIVKYKNYRWETRMDSIFGFKSWDTDYADNYSSVESLEKNQNVSNNI